MGEMFFQFSNPSTLDYFFLYQIDSRGNCSFRDQKTWVSNENFRFGTDRIKLIKLPFTPPQVNDIFKFTILPLIVLSTRRLYHLYKKNLPCSFRDKNSQGNWPYGQTKGWENINGLWMFVVDASTCFLFSIYYYTSSWFYLMN